MTTSIRLFVSVLSVLACLRLGATPSYRVSLEGGAPDGTWTEKSSFAEAVRFCDNCADGVIELLADDEETLTGAVWLGVESGGMVTTAKPKLTIRSDSRGATRYTLKRAAAGSYMRLCQTCTEMTVVFTNIVLDGGAKWADKDNFLSTTQETGGIGCTSGYAFMVYGSVGRLHFAKDAILQNYAHPSGSVIEFLYGTSTSHVYFDPGSLVRDCRGKAFLQDSGNVGSVFVDGATFTRCGATTHGLFLWYGQSAQTGRRVFHDAILTNNAVIGSSTETGQGVVEVRNAAVVELTGNTIIKDNFLSNGTTPANFFAWGDTNLKVSAPLTSPAGSIGFKYKNLATATVGKKFGEVTDASYTDGTAFFWDGNSADLTVCGEVSGSDLVWRLNQIVYEAHHWVGYYDGKPHSPRVTVSQPDTGAVVWYRLTDQDEWSTTVPSRMAVGSDTVRFKITASGIADVVGTVELTVWDPSYVPEKKCRVRINGGAWTLYDDFVAAADAVTAQTRVDEAATIELELLCDSIVTSESSLYIGDNNGSAKDRQVFVRSNSDTGQRFVLKRQSNKFTLIPRLPNTANTKIVFENLILDGGAKWKHVDDFSSVEQEAGGIASASCLIELSHQVAQNAHFGKDLVIQNVYSGDYGSAVICPIYGNQAKLYFEEGVVIRDCRGGAVLHGEQGFFSAAFDGATITRCGGGTFGLLFFWDRYSNATGTYSFRNVAITNNAPKGEGVVEVRNTACLRFGSNVRITDNWRISNRAAAGVYSYSTANIRLVEKMREKDGSSVGIHYAAASELGTAFGAADAALPWNAADGFCNDFNPKLVGCVEEGVLKWMKRVKGFILQIR